jgi:hypothetical protein
MMVFASISHQLLIPVRIPMSIPFTRSTRSMNHDRFIPSLVGIILISLVLILWMSWFFTGQLAVYATAISYQVREDGMLLGSFPADSLAQIIPGQQAELILPPQNGKSAAPIQAEVMNIPASDGEPVEIYLFSTDLPAGAPTGQLKILMGKTTPAQIIWNSIQK